MNSRDQLIDDILNEINANRGTAGASRPVSNRQEAKDLADEIVAEKRYKPRPSAPVQPRPEPAAPAVTRGEDEKKSRAKKTDGEEDLLSQITPWSERHKDGTRGLQKTEAGAIENKPQSSKKGIKDAQQFFDVLRKSQKPKKEEKPDLLYAGNAEVPHQQAPVPAAAPGPMREVSDNTLRLTVRKVTKRMEERNEPTRVIPMNGAEAKTTAFALEQEDDQLEGQVRLPGFEEEAVPAPSEQEWEGELEEKRQDKVRRFKMEQKPDDSAEITVEEDGEYHSVQDAPALKYDLLTRRRNTGTRFWVTLILFGLNLFVCFTPTFDITNGLLADNPLLLMGLYVGLLGIAFLVNASTVITGIRSLAAGADGDTPAGLAVLAALVQGVLMLAFSDAAFRLGGATVLVGCSAYLALLLNLLGKRVQCTRMYRNLNLIGNNRRKMVVETVPNKQDAFELGRGFAKGEPPVVYARPFVDAENFIYHSYAPDGGEIASRLPGVLLPVFGLAGGAMAFFFTPHTDAVSLILQCVTGICFGICACLPLTAFLAGGLPMSRFCRGLGRQRVMLSGYDAVEEHKNTKVLTVDAADLFPKGTVRLKSIKSASNQSLDRSLMDVAGVVYTAECPLKPLFEEIIQGKASLLPEVDTLVYEEEMGLSGWVMGYRVLIGTRKLMENHGVIIPDTDFEQKAGNANVHAVYLSTQGILSAVFLVEYTVDPELKQALQRAKEEGLGLHVYSCDPNVTREMICRLFDLPAAMVRVMGATPRRLYKQYAALQKPAEAVLTYEGGAAAYILGIASCQKLRRVVRFASVLQTIGVLAGLLCCIACLLVGGHANGLLLLLVQLITTAATLGLPLLAGR